MKDQRYLDELALQEWLDSLNEFNYGQNPYDYDDWEEDYDPLFGLGREIQ